MISALNVGGLTYTIDWVEEKGSRLMQRDQLYETNSYACSITIHSHIPDSVNISLLMDIGIYFWFRGSMGWVNGIDQKAVDRASNVALSLMANYPPLLDLDSYSHIEKIMVSSRVYTLSDAGAEVLGDDGTTGTHSLMRGEILLHTDLCDNRRCYDRWHELTHAIDSAVQNEWDEELVSLFSTAVCGIIRQNPELVKWIRETYHHNEVS